LSAIQLSMFCAVRKVHEKDNKKTDRMICFDMTRYF